MHLICLFDLVWQKGGGAKGPPHEIYDIDYIFCLLNKTKKNTSRGWVAPSWVELSLADVKSSLKLSWNNLLSKEFCFQKSLVKTFLSPKNFGSKKVWIPNYLGLKNFGQKNFRYGQMSPGQMLPEQMSP